MHSKLSYLNLSPFHFGKSFLNTNISRYQYRYIDAPNSIQSYVFWPLMHKKSKKKLLRYAKCKIPKNRGFLGAHNCSSEFRIWQYDALSTWRCWNSFRWEICNGEGTEESNPPLIEESGPWTFPGSPTRSTTYSLFRNING